MNNNGMLLSRIQLIKDQIVHVRDNIETELIYSIKDSWKDDESIFYIHRVEEITSDLRLIILFCEELQNMM